MRERERERERERDREREREIQRQREREKERDKERIGINCKSSLILTAAVPYDKVLALPQVDSEHVEGWAQASV